MKKNITILCSVVLLLIMITILVVTQVYANNDTKILNGRKIGSPEEAYSEIKTQARSVKSISNNSDIYNTANSYIEKIGENIEKFDQKTSKVKYYNNAVESRIETKILNNDTIVTLNEENELISYITQKTDFLVNTCTESQIRDKAIEIFNNINIENSDDYELTNLEAFDEEIWRAEFCKKYNGNICKGESIKFSFAPETDEVVTMAINRIKYANNEIAITEEDATNIAKEYLGKSIATEMIMNKEIVRPNYFYRQLEGDENIYANVNQSRNAYVFTFNNDAKSQVYVDCTTGEVIGGNMIAGGIY